MKLSGWGNYPSIDATVQTFTSEKELCGRIAEAGTFIPFGMGRSYGDSALNSRVFFTRRFNRIRAFDPDAGKVVCEGGVTLDDVIRTCLPRGWFPAITPGTRFITLGGAVAADVHGKNHHAAGCFSECVTSLELMLPGGDVISCTRDTHPDLFHATCGGMGLTGMILTVAFSLRPVKSGYLYETDIPCGHLQELFDAFEQHRSAPYSVAWIDCLAKGRGSGRAILMLGRHADAGALRPPPSHGLSMPFHLPGIILNRFSVAAFNRVYHYLKSSSGKDRLTSFERFYYPLDAVGNWNRIYGRKGFVQYQFVLPKEAGFEGMSKVLKRLADAGAGSFLAVLKLLGRANDNLLSFPLEGYTLAVDIKMTRNLFSFLEDLDRVVLDYGGRFYLAKDARLKPDVFARGYPGLDRFREIRAKYGMEGKITSLQAARLKL